MKLKTCLLLVLGVSSLGWSTVESERLTEDQIKNIISDLGRGFISPKCGEIMVKGFSKLGFPKRDFKVESLSSYAEQTIRNAREIVSAVAQEECGCYEIISCLLPLEICLMSKGQVEEIMVHHVFGAEHGTKSTSVL